ncbi:MAG: PBSX family phage terminase large subunit, partial [Candidatus Riflebacteria bacterium]|nr:PBSX family phage terminase large subunit [Candidatus Riflebacteria bacterium]
MKINKFSEKQKEIIRFTKDNNRILICDGAVRSGKTMAMSLSFILWAMANFNDTNFAICGKTVSSAERNIVRPIQTLIQGIFEFKYMISNRCLVITSGKKQNFFYFFGGKDESSYQLIQGLSAGGVLFDEVALMPKSFVEQAIARTLSYNNSKLWFNCNPDSASHWFYKEWIEDRKPKTKHLHFLMEDNPIITDEEIETAKKLYTGVFYERYILGRWVTAEGIIFRKFAEETERYLTDTKDTNINTFSKITIGVDFGGTGSLTTFVATGFIGYYQELVVLEEYKIKGENIDTLQICEGFIDFYN